jgi:hypothetical protein
VFVPGKPDQPLDARDAHRPRRSATSKTMRMTREPAARMQNQDVMIGVGPAVETTTISTLQTPRTKDMLPP